ncbi:FAD-dependent oxidoreductase [Opitutia bacterium ISCC 51]|nr:FAD-dependent oxidoreductase [Opitutae bacterium ISCC 51]QXD27665.1 FAD-dependent oxidoreductase [Opitutae bacterium ISCC 52]
MKHKTSQIEFLVIGAGMTGLAAANALTQSGKEVVLLDKARGVGGRLGNRRFDGAVFDHGAQFITARDGRFKRLTLDWQNRGIIKEWRQRKLGADVVPRFRGSPTMSAIAKELGQNLDIRLSSPVGSIKQEGDEWSISLKEGEHIQANALLITPPVTQSLAILDAGKISIPEETRQRLEKIQYEKCFAVMVLLEQPSCIPKPGYFKLKKGPIAWIADNQIKGISEIPAVTIHATGEYSETNWERDRDEIARDLIHSAKEWLGSSVVKYQIHGWRYSKPTTTNVNLCEVISQHPPLLMAGDAFASARVEGAVLSGWAAAGTLLELRSNFQKSQQARPI